jgi:hypothetical protein
MGKDYFKSWRLVFNPKDTIQDFSVGFAPKSGAASNIQGITLKSIAKDVIANGTLDITGYASSDIFNIHIVKTDPTSLYLWQSKLADLSYKTISASAGVCPMLLGPLAVGSSITSSFVFRNMSAPLTITSVSALVTTLQLSSVKTGLTRDQVANDFSVEVVSKGTISIFTGAALLKDLPVVVTLANLDELEIKVTYTPKLKVVPTAAMLSPYNATTAPSVAASINSNRKLQISLKNNGVTVGDVLELKGSVI